MPRQEAIPDAGTITAIGGGGVNGKRREVRADRPKLGPATAAEAVLPLAAGPTVAPALPVRPSAAPPRQLSTPELRPPKISGRENGCGWGAAPVAAAPRPGPRPESALSKNIHLRSRPESAPETLTFV